MFAQGHNHTHGGGVVRNIYISTRMRDTSKYPSASEFVMDLPVALKQVHSVRVKNFKYTPEPLINNNNNTLTFTANGGTSSGTIAIAKGDYNQDVMSLLAALNSQLNSYDIAFMVDPVTDLVQMTFSGTSYTSDYFRIPLCPILQLLGFTTGIHLYRSAYPPSQQMLMGSMTAFNTRAIATNLPTTANDTDLILRITDVEAIYSIDNVCNRATAIIMSNRSPNGVSYILQETLYPLLQVQSRIQQLRVAIVNSDGNPYDLFDHDASFIIEFHCYPESCPPL
jgi:hypothetical protein